MRVERLSLYAEDTGRCLMVYKPSSDVLMLPPGKYRLLSYQALRRDAHGDLWRLSAAGTYDSPVVVVAPNIAALLKMGEPYMPVVDLGTPKKDTYTGRGNIPLFFNIEGAGKEHVFYLTTIANADSRWSFLKRRDVRKLPKEPTFVIVKADGEIAARGSFHYG
jgi:hypothetical protein